MLRALKKKISSLLEYVCLHCGIFHLRFYPAVKHLKFPSHLSWVTVEKDPSQGRLCKNVFLESTQAKRN